MSVPTWKKVQKFRQTFAGKKSNGARLLTLRSHEKIGKSGEKRGNFLRKKEALAFEAGTLDKLPQTVVEKKKRFQNHESMEGLGGKKIREVVGLTEPENNPGIPGKGKRSSQVAG